MFQILFISSVLAISYARPNYENYEDTRNVITVPANCPPGQEWISGQCRDIWRSGVTPPTMSWGKQDFEVGNVIIVPPNCPPGQQYINGQCRDIWFFNSMANSNFYNQIMEKLWSEHIQKIQQLNGSGSSRNIINVPNQCPIGFKPDALGNCRPIL